MNARQIVEVLLDELEYTDPAVRDFMAGVETTERERQFSAQKQLKAQAEKRQQELKTQEREAGEETERHMRAQGIKVDEPAPGDVQIHTGPHAHEEVRAYFAEPHPELERGMRKVFGRGFLPQVKVATTTPGKPAAPSAKSASTDIHIKGAQKYWPKHRFKPKTWWAQPK